MILFYRDYFFPAGHVDAGKPVPLGLCAQLGHRPHQLSAAWVAYKSLFIELELAGYATTSRNGDDPLQERLREEKYQLTDNKPFAELYRIGVARSGLAAPVVVVEQLRLLPKVAHYLERTSQALALANDFRKTYKEMHRSRAGVLAESVAVLQFAVRAKNVFKPSPT